MSKHEGLPVEGYRAQTSTAVEAVNANKRFEETLLRLLDDLAERDDVDRRWLAIGRTDIERGFMAINRAIFRPERIRLPEDQ